MEGLFPVHLVSSASEALRFMEEHEVAILVTDQRMPQMTGIELCEIARRRHPGVRRVHALREALDESGSILPTAAMETLAGEMDCLDEAVNYLLGLHQRTRRLSLRNTSQKGRVLLAEIRERLFEPFRTTRHDSGGTGLGLSICRSLAKSNDGSIALLPSPTGTTFEVRLPRATAT